MHSRPEPPADVLRSTHEDPHPHYRRRRRRRYRSPGRGAVLVAGPASAATPTGLKSATVCVTAPDGSPVLAHTKVVAVSWKGQAYRETSVKKVDASGCATVYFGTTGRVYFRAVGVTRDAEARTTKTYRARWGTYDAAAVPDGDAISGSLKLVRTATR